MIRTIQLVLAVFILAGSALARQPQERAFTSQLWEENRDIFEHILAHPFLKGLSDGSLEKDAFSFYMIQDAHYLGEFARALSIAASKAPKEEWMALLNTHAADALKYERQLHESVFREFEIAPAQIAAFEPSPEAVAYTNFLLAIASQHTFAESIAALLPCYWIYWEVGKELRLRGSKNEVYRRWIETYASDAYGETVKEVLRMVDELAEEASPSLRQRMRENYRRSSRYEWMFWDSAYHRRKWPPITGEQPSR
ncbi:MAG: thiaminase II [Acidobacteria bacterium]|nr:thiaminase II [Acidobacteriota bacterium]